MIGGPVCLGLIATLEFPLSVVKRERRGLIADAQLSGGSFRGGIEPVELHPVIRVMQRDAQRESLRRAGWLLRRGGGEQP